MSNIPRGVMTGWRWSWYWPSSLTHLIITLQKIYIAVPNRPALVFKLCTLSREDPFLEMVIKFHIYSHDASRFFASMLNSAWKTSRTLLHHVPKKSYSYINKPHTKSLFFFAKWSKLAFKKLMDSVLFISRSSAVSLCSSPAVGTF